MTEKAGSRRSPLALQGSIQDHLAFLYGSDESRRLWEQLEAILRDFQERSPPREAESGAAPLTEKDAILITYGDQFREKGGDGSPAMPPLQNLHELLTGTLRPPISGIRLLPFFPYSSDYGFSVVDYTQVNPQMGT